MSVPSGRAAREPEGGRGRKEGGALATVESAVDGMR